MIKKIFIGLILTALVAGMWSCADKNTPVTTPVENTQKDSTGNTQPATLQKVETGETVSLSVYEAVLQGTVNVDIRKYSDIRFGFLVSTDREDLEKYVGDTYQGTVLRGNTFTVSVKPLPAETGYYYRAWLMLNNIQVVYGEIKSFTTDVVTVTTADTVSVSNCGALLRGMAQVDKNDYAEIRFGFLLSQTDDTPEMNTADMYEGAEWDGDGFTIAAEPLQAETRYYYRAWIMLDNLYLTYGEVKSFTTKSLSGTAAVMRSAGRDSCAYAQLWAGGPKWAAFNVGATITDYAQLTEGADPTPYYYYTYLAPYFNTANVGGLYAWNNPNINGRQTAWGSNVSTGVSDVASTLWGSNWKTPTRQQLDTLQNSSYGKTTWTWCDGSTTQYVAGCTLAGYKVSGVGEYARMCIFLPAAGSFQPADSLIYVTGFGGYYWSDTEDDSNDAYGLYFYSDEVGLFSANRKNGHSVRAVLAK